MYNFILIDKKLNSNDKILFSFIQSLNDNDSMCFASNKYLSEQLGICEKTIQSSINKLIKVGYIKKSKIKKGTITKRILYVSLKGAEKVETNKIESCELIDYNWLEELDN